ncbi:hypothetical protein GXW71_32700 [Roseomonas hellenica]|uniref:Uncharacterized protein n=1 Tax=Plastoroseomonas hellenica TaxID=2687306 RepID=A0ABS5F9B4_9PROT|nr:hypothetical protein [Plastoroseomonas hellenica]MBR0669156.1 hypothetical protein [Plastoroseomonas hellenica]
MPFDPPARAATLPAWLTPGLIGELATTIEEALAAGATLSAAQETALMLARALHPALPAPDLREALSLAMHVLRDARTDGRPPR